MTNLKGYSSGQSHFSEINAKLAEENEFVTENRSEIIRILVLAMTTADDDVGGSNSVWEVVARFSLFYKQNGAFWVQ